MIHSYKNTLRTFFLKSILFYQKYLSLILGGQCRFTPTCSEYARQCFTHMPLSKAFLKSLWRILRCNPLSKGYEDEPFKKQDKK